VPFGHTVGGGGGGGGQGVVAATCEPSGQVCIAGALGVVAQAESTAVAATRNPIRLTFVSFTSFPAHNETAATTFPTRGPGASASN
jgi:hypothetical protein